MKKCFTLIFLVFSVVSLFAQRVATTTNPSVQDTVKAKWGRVKIVNGTAMVSSNDIIENIARSKEYSTLITAIEDAGLTETFKSKGPITVFAPTNQAFGHLPAGTLDSLLLPSHKFDLSYLLTYHAIAGRITA